MQDLDPANPWVKDPSGKHTNISALLDWPEESDESDNEMDNSRSVPQASAPEENAEGGGAGAGVGGEEGAEGEGEEAEAGAETTDPSTHSTEAGEI
jgi:hypothetical protein